MAFKINAKYLLGEKIPIVVILFELTGDRYIVVDGGGGTVDVTVHQIRLPEGHLKELYKATGKIDSSLLLFIEHLISSL